ncbi:hypothetical protein [uncultured Brevundimonas sp.]|uniref:hypothetical protein n=1 Tax=uncultured Brevundimonas sp. TaxID=213418 RepID=UPI0025DD7AEB|nr:hypothetical protein [uncultured Brevundimonas sp.]
MNRTALAMAAGFAALAASSAQACIIHTELRLNDVREADAIAVGKVIKFQTQSPPESSLLEKWLRGIESRRNVTDAEDWTDRTRVTFRVREVISGRLPSTVVIDWPLDSNNGPPERMSGNYLFAVRDRPDTAESLIPTHELLHQSCSGSFVFRRGSSAANTIREMYGLWPERLEAEPKTLSDLFKLPSVPWYISVVVGIFILLGVQVVAVLLQDQRSGRR